MNKSAKFGRGTLTFLCCLLAMPTAAHILPGISSDSLETSLMAGALLGACYLLLRPILRLVSLPIGCLTLGAFNFVIDMALILLLPRVFPGFQVDGFLWAALAALLVDGVCMVTGGIH